VSGNSNAVFLSYASQDAEPASRICDALRTVGIEVWFDQSELRGGDAWDATIRRQIKSCALFVPLISNNTRSRGEGLFSPRMEAGGGPLAPDGGRPAVPGAGDHRRRARLRPARTGALSRGPVDQAAERRSAAGVRCARPASARIGNADGEESRRTSAARRSAASAGAWQRRRSCTDCRGRERQAPAKDAVAGARRRPRRGCGGHLYADARQERAYRRRPRIRSRTGA
jgi:hypothetical protein